MTYENKLTQSNWYLKDLKLLPSDTSIFFWIDSCFKDNYTKYFMDGTYTDYEGVLKCIPTEPIEQRGTWWFSSDKKTLYTTDYLGAQTNYTILLLDNTTLQLQYSDTNAIIYKLIFKTK